jgi:Zn-dependent protease
MPDLRTILLFFPPIVAALTVHEFSHGYVAWRLGDSTAKDQGRLTLNPLAHLDPIGTVLLLLVHFGWAKPVPVDPRNFANPRRDMLWVALAGPGSNIIFAFIVGSILQFSLSIGILHPTGYVYIILAFTVFINLMLAFFNLIPIPPLDGSRIVAGLLPHQYLRQWYSFERIGGYVLMGIIVFGMITHISIFGSTIYPIAKLFYNLFTNGAPSLF